MLMNDGFEEIMAQASPSVRELARRTRALIESVMPDVVEVAWPKQRTIGYGVGPKKMSEHFCYIGVFKSRINLGFFYGSELPDPENLLEGTGKLLRHIKIGQVEQLENPAVRDLIEVASGYLPNLKKS